MNFIVKKGKKDSSGIKFNPFVGHIIEGTAKLDKSCIYDRSKMTPREASSYQKITGLANLFKFSTQSGRLAFRMEEYYEAFELSTYMHINGPYDVIERPGKHLGYVHPDEEFYYRIDWQDYNIKFTLNDAVVNEPTPFKKPLITTLMYFYFEAGDLPANHDMTLILNRK